MGWVLVVIGIVALCVGLINQLSLWRATEGWKFRNPEANEPSDFVLALTKVGLLAAGVVMIGIGFFVNVDDSGNLLGKRPDPKPAAEDLALKVEARSPLLIWKYSNVSPAEAVRRTVDTALGEVDKRAHLKVRTAAQAKGVHAFTLDAARDRTFCLTVTERGPAKPAMRDTRAKDGYPTEVGVDLPIEATLAEGACKRM